jgi:hypothetical protein
MTKYIAKVYQDKDTITAVFHSQGYWIDFIKPYVYACQDAGLKINLSDIIESGNRSVILVLPSKNTSGKILVKKQVWKTRCVEFGTALISTIVYFGIIMLAITIGKLLIR